MLCSNHEQLDVYWEHIKEFRYAMIVTEGDENSLVNWRHRHTENNSRVCRSLNDPACKYI